MNLYIIFNPAKFPVKFVFVLLISLGLMVSCSNDFLDIQPPSSTVAGDTIFMISNIRSFEQEINLHNTQTASWKLYQFPRWLEVNPKIGTANPASEVNFQFHVKENEMYFSLGFFAVPLVFDVENVGLVQHTVVLWNVGEPEISNTPSVIETDQTLQGMFQVVNSGYGILAWEVVSKPEWLTLETTDGILDAHEYGIWQYRINTDGLEPGDYSGNVEIWHTASNDSYFIEFNFTVEEKDYYGGYLTGEFVDAAYIGELNQVAVLTKNPNNLLFFNVNSSKADTLKLNRVPQCLALSEDGNTLAVGFSNTEISTYSADSRTLLNTYSSGSVPTHIAFGGENKVFYLNHSGYGYLLTGLDLETSGRYTSVRSNGGLSELKKVPGKDLLLSTRAGWSPDGLFLFDLSHGLVTDSLNEYWVQTNGLWLSQDGERIFAGTRKIYRVPEYIPGKSWVMEAPPLLGEFDLGGDLRINSITHHKATSVIFVACDEAWNPGTSYIKMFDYNTLAIQETWELKSNPPYGYPPGNSWYSQVTHIFPALAGNEIWIIQQQPAADYRDPGTFSIERLAL